MTAPRIPLALVVSLLLLPVGWSSTSAQTGSITRSPLDPKTEFPRMGIEGGLSWVTQTGTYTSGCGTFTGGSGINVVLAGAYDYPISGYVRLEGLLGLQTRHTGSNYNTVENTVIRTSGGFIESDVTYENQGAATFTYAFVQPSVKWYPFKNIYVGAGLGADLFTGASTRYSKSIVTRVVNGAGGEVVEVAYPDADSRDGITKDYPPQDRSDASGLTFDVAAYVGLELSIYPRLRFSPRLTYTLPLTPALSEPGETEMKLSTLQATIGFRYVLLD